jgi:hypothetical protein
MNLQVCETDPMKHLGRYLLRYPAGHTLRKIDGWKVTIYLHDFQGNAPDPGNVFVQYLDGTWDQMSEDTQVEERTPKEGKAWWNPKPAQVGAWKEKFLFVWISESGEEKIIMPQEGDSRNKYLVNVARELAPETLLPLIAGHIYRSKKPREVGFLTRAFDDRALLRVGPFTCQYDSSTVTLGKHYPTVDKTAFWLWAGEDVTEEYKSVPDGEWAKYRKTK